MASASVDLSLYTDDEREFLISALDEKERLAAQTDQERSWSSEKRRLESDLAAFAREAWKVLEPGVELDWSWHYDLICEYLTLVYLRKCTRLIINISPRTAKSTFVSVIFPAWVWAKQNTHNFACASYSGELSTEHSVKRRDLISSEWYQGYWSGTVRLAKDQNQKTKFKNTSKAQMLATSVGGTAVGLGGDTLILDDGMNPKQVASDAETKTAHDWFDDTWRTRLNDLATGAFIIMEQRTGQRDMTGHCLEADDVLEKAKKPREWTHLSIPLVCEGQPERYVFPISKRVVVREVGDVLQPKRFPPEVITSLQSRRLVFATQYGQRPSPLEGNMIKVADIRYYGGRHPTTQDLDPPKPPQFDLVLVSADCAFKDIKTSDMVAIAAIGVKGPDRFVLEVTNAHLDLPATETEILRLQQLYGARTILVEDKANGSAIIKSIRRKVSGVVAVDPLGGKEARMFAACGSFQAGNWWFPRTAAWTIEAIHQLTAFPGAKYDDIADAITQADAHISRNSHVYGFTEYIKQQEAAAMAKKAPKKSIPANATPEEKMAIENPQTVGKIETDDKTVRCVNEDCLGTLLQRTPGGLRCAACGTMQPKQGPGVQRPATTDFGFRK